MKLPAYGKALWDRRLSGQRPRVVCLLVGNTWTLPKWLPAEIPRLAVKTAAWHEPAAERFDWRVVAACTVLAVDVRGPDERAENPDGWDSWLWLLGQVQTYARDVLMFTPMQDVIAPPDWFAAERDLEVYAWCSCTNGAWPPWWPHGNSIMERAA